MNILWVLPSITNFFSAHGETKEQVGNVIRNDFQTDRVSLKGNVDRMGEGYSLIINRLINVG